MYTPLKVICIVFNESKHTIIFSKNIILIISLIEKILIIHYTVGSRLDFIQLHQKMKNMMK